MTSPIDFRDDMLSGYLDGELSADERSSLESLLQGNAELRDRLESLRRIRQRLKATQQATSSTVSPDFAQRVLARVFAEADRLELPLEHPVQLARRHSSATETRSSRLWVGVAVVGMLAASLALFMVRLNLDSPEASNQNLAQSPVDAPNPDLPSELIIDGLPIKEQPIHREPLNDPKDLLASTSPSPSELSSSALSSNGKSSSDVELETPSVPVKVPSVASADKGATRKKDPMVAVIMMVFEVHLQDPADVSPITEALQVAEIGMVRDTTVDEGYVSQLAKSGLVADRKADSEDSSLQVLAIEAPAKRLGRFLAELSRKDSGIVNFRYGMTQNRELIRATLAILDRSNSDGGEEASVQRINLAGEYHFQPPKEGQLQMVGQGVPFKSFGDDGPDFLTSVILIVR